MSEPNAGNINVNNESKIYHDEPTSCPICFPAITADRPPILNLDNRSCAEAGGALRHRISGAERAAMVDLMSIGFEHSPPTLSPSSRATSDNGSIALGEGPERRDPGSNYLPLAPAVGLGEMQHRRRASFDGVHAGLSYSMHRYLTTLSQAERSLHGPWVEEHQGWLRQDMHLMGPLGGSSMTAAKGRSAKASTSSAFGASIFGMTPSSGSGSDGKMSGGFDVAAFGLGAWTDGEEIEDWMYGNLVIDDEMMEV